MLALLDWNKILKWLLLAALAVAIVAVPLVYVKHLESSSYAAGHTAGVAEVQLKVDAANAAVATAREAIAQRESDEAQKRLADNVKFNSKVHTLESKLQAALQDHPLPVGCLLNSNATGVLRSAAGGEFEDDSGAISGGPPPEVSRDAAISK